jgi:poly(beta-D-mannuronate) lyase
MTARLRSCLTGRGLLLASAFSVAGIIPLHGTQIRVASAEEISAAMNVARPGDTLTMANGLWTDAAIMFAGYGTASAPIVLRGESYGGVILGGTSTLRISGSNLVVDGLLFRNGYSPSGAVVEFQGTYGQSDSCRLTNCSILEYNPADLAVDYKWISLYGTHNRVDHCYLRGKKHQGSTLVVWVDTSRSNYHQIDHNYFAPRPPLGTNGGETIRVGTGLVSLGNSYTLVEYNYFEQCNGDAEIVSNKSCGNAYRYNTFVSCQGTLSMRQGHRTVIEGNFLLGNGVSGTGGIRLMGEDHLVFNNYVAGVTDDKSGCALAMMNGTAPGVTPAYLQVKRAIVAFNTFVADTYTIGLGVNNNGGILPPDSCVIANNVAYAVSSKPVITVYTAPTNVTWQGDIFYGASLGIAQPAGITWVNPQMAVAGDGLWRPGPSSPVINASVSPSTYPYVTMDMDGQARDATPDVGSDEASTGTITRRPLTPADVGPPAGMITSVGQDLGRDRPAAQSVELEQNFPNPFNPETSIGYRILAGGHVELRVFDLLGREVAVLVNENRPPGSYRAAWNAAGVPSGTYFCRLRTGGREVTIKMGLVR